MKRTVYVVDDEDAIRRSLRLMLGVQGYAVTLFDSGTSLLDALDSLVPGCLLLDIRMPGIDGLDVLRELAARDAGLPTIVMTGHGEHSVALSALRNGALSFLEKPFAKSTAVEALDTAFLKLEDPGGYQDYLVSIAARLQALNETERSLLAGLVDGRSSETIAAELSAEPAELEMSRSRILEKLGVDEITEAFRMAFAAGFCNGTPRNIT